MMTAPFTLTHVIPAREIAAEERRIGEVLLRSGYDPRRLRLDQVATDAKLSDLEDEAAGLAIRIVSRAWAVTLDGDVEVVMGFAREADAVAMKLAVG